MGIPRPAVAIDQKQVGIAVAILANRDLSTGWTVAPARWARLNNAIVAALTAGE